MGRSTGGVQNDKRFARQVRLDMLDNRVFPLLRWTVKEDHFELK